MEEQSFGFGETVNRLENRKFLARKGWNGKKMYIWMVPGAEVPVENIHEPHLKALAEANGGKMVCLPTIRMRTATGEILTGWLASQSDIFAKDWVEVVPEAHVA